MEILKGMQTSIQSYKHTELIHRIWKHTKIVDVRENFIVTAHKKTRVVENNGRSWFTREPALCYFYDDRWFNVIVMFKKDGIYYYCNIASPYVVDEEGIKYIDYDLDVKVYPDGSYKILDQNEYAYHKQKMKYPEQLQKILEEELQKLVVMVETKEPPFNHDYVEKDLEAFKDLKKRRRRRK